MREMKEMRKPFLKFLCIYLSMAMFIIGITPKAFAGFSPSEIIGLSPVDRASDLKKIQKFIEMKMVRERLKQLGFTPEEVKARLNLLSDQELHHFALQLDELKVGGDGLGILIVILLVAALVILIIYVTGHRLIITSK